jgi:hypothetical protein
MKHQWSVRETGNKLFKILTTKEIIDEGLFIKVTVGIMPKWSLPQVASITKECIYITGFEYIGKYPATCISVDSKDKLYICANGIPTHNTKGGLEMLVNMAQRNIDLGIENINMDIVVPAIQKLVIYNMLFTDEENIKGNFRVKEYYKCYHERPACTEKEPV